MQPIVERAANCLPRTAPSITVRGAFLGANGSFAVDHIETPTPTPLAPTDEQCVRHAFEAARVAGFSRARFGVTRTFGPPAVTASSSPEPFSANVVARVIRGHLGAIRGCYERQLSEQRDLEGRLVVHFTIDATGGVSSANSAALLRNGDLDRASVFGTCVEDEFRRMHFPPPGFAQDFSFPFTFSPGTSDTNDSVAVSPAEQLPPPPPEAPRAASLAFPGATTGALDERDWRLSSGGIYDDYEFDLTAGDVVTIVVRGGPSTIAPNVRLDPYIFLLRNGIEVLHDDDSAGDLNGRLVFAPRVSGRYVLRVSTYGSGSRRGAYTIETWRGAIENAR